MFDDVETPVRVFVGCAPNHEDAESQAVLEYTLRANSSRNIQITWMKHQKRGPFAGWNGESWATPFTGFRWAIPGLCGYQGVAIYVDSDFIFKADIGELADQSFGPGKGLKTKNGAGRSCIAVFNCAVFGSLPDWPSLEKLQSMGSGHSHCSNLVSRHNLREPFDGLWNVLDTEQHIDIRDQRVKAVHYTSMRHQPHLIKYAIPRLKKAGRTHWFDSTPKPHFNKAIQELFDTALKEAEAAGFTVDSYCQDPIFGDYKKRSVAGVADFGG